MQATVQLRSPLGGGIEEPLGHRPPLPQQRPALDRPVIFLDVDGVLHSLYGEDLFRETCMTLLASIVHATGALLVLSSTWRKEAAKVGLLNEALRRRSLPSITECTKVLDEPRAAEICEWLDRHPEVSRWIAIDDMDLLGALVRPKQIAQASRLRGHLVRTRCEDGLTQPEADLAIRLLSRQNGTAGHMTQRVSAQTSPSVRVCLCQPAPSAAATRSRSPGCSRGASAQTDLLVRTRVPSPNPDRLLRTRQRAVLSGSSRGPSPAPDQRFRTRVLSPHPDQLLRTRGHSPHADPLVQTRGTSPSPWRPDSLLRTRDQCPYADPLLHSRQSVRGASPAQDTIRPTRGNSPHRDPILGNSPQRDPLLRTRPQHQSNSLLGPANARQTTHGLLPEAAALRSAGYMPTLDTAQAVHQPTVRAQSPHFQRPRMQAHAGCSVEVLPMFSKMASSQPIRASPGILVLA